jgi:membrane-associated phospholipid phosphatase
MKIKRHLVICFLLILSYSFCFGQKTGFEKSGDVLEFALPLTAFASTLIWRDDSKPTLQFVKTMGLALTLNYGLKFTINEPRPNGGNYSFPSGHTLAAFTGASFLERRFGWKVGIPAYLLAGYVGWTRVYANKHYWWDVVGGAIIGTGCSYLFAKEYKKDTLDIGLSMIDDTYVACIKINF